MDDDNLFDEFDSDVEESKSKNSKNKNGNNKNKKSFVGQKHERENENENETKFVSTKKKVNISITNEENNNMTDNQEENPEQVEDILIEKSVKRILPHFSTDEYLKPREEKEENSEDNPSNLGMKIETVHFRGGYHETITPKDSTIKPTILKKDPNKKPATTYPFKLDPFQERAILCLENHQSVLVAAHTSAGKTVVAQYAIAMALRDKQRVIYTSPIKALSNQKYRELKHEFHDVGLMTGDVTLNPTASCIVMTTEILRNMLFRGSEITREMAWVIFDEVHYMRDKERGVVWEETIILLSNKINYVFLSATIPNAREFAMWISKLKSQPCNVVYTDYRPVPLQHYVYPSGHNGILLVVDSKGNFREENFSIALDVLNEQLKLDNIFDKSKNTRMKNQRGKEQDIKKIVSLIDKSQLNPAIVFSFSKRDCEDRALALSKMDFTTDEEKEAIEMIYTKAIQTLSTEDQNLPQIQMMLPILKKGIGIHHGGMLPIVKECVELIFQEGLIKTLFSTETFSMGINMPAKTVVFTTVEKWDGEQTRWLGGGEYIQMSGRAGRRGIDEKGITIMMLNKKMDQDVCRNMLNGKADPLISSFHLNYNQLVNLYRLEGMESEYIVKRSFRQFQAERSVPLLKRELGELYAKYLTKFKNDYEKDNAIHQIIEIKQQIKDFNEKAREIINHPENIVPYLCPGRMIKLTDFGIGIVVNYKKQNIEITKKRKKQTKKDKVLGISSAGLSDDESDPEEENVDSYGLPGINENETTFIVDTLVYVHNYIDQNSKLVPGNIKKKDGKLGVVPFVLEAFEGVSPMVVTKIPKNLKDPSGIELAEKIMFDIFERKKGEIPLMDPIKDMDIKDEKLKEYLDKIKNLEDRLEEIEHKFLQKYDQKISEKDLNGYEEKIGLRNEIKEKIQKITSVKKLVLQDQLNSMKRVLRRLEFIKDDVVLTKGQVACNISSGDELLLTEMLFSGALNDIEPNCLAALLTCFLSNEGSNGSKEGEDKLVKKPLLKELHDKIKQSAERIADVLIDCKIEVTKDTYIEQFKPDYMVPVYEWAEGKSFGDISTDIYEGNLIRVIRRLDELIKELIDSAGLIGNVGLKEKLEKASELIRKGIPFAASLYLAS